MEERTTSVVEFISEASSTFCDTYYKQGCGECPMNLSHGQCVLMDLPEIIRESIHNYLKHYNQEEETHEFNETDGKSSHLMVD